MSQIHRKFTPEFKSKVVLELLETGKSVNEIASKYNLLPKSVTTWKKQFFDNASSAFEDSVSAKKYKDEIKEKEQKIEELEKTLGRTVMESIKAKCFYVAVKKSRYKSQRLGFYVGLD